jgi:hypothetical protein
MKCDKLFKVFLKHIDYPNLEHRRTEKVFRLDSTIKRRKGCTGRG